MITQTASDPEDKTLEEMAELAHAIFKARRFGYYNYHPKTGFTTDADYNIERIKREIDDVRAALDGYHKYLDSITRIKKAGE